MGLSEAGACAEKGRWEVEGGVKTTNKNNQQGFFSSINIRETGETQTERNHVCPNFS